MIILFSFQCPYFTIFDTIQKLPEKADIVTMFHVLEHLKDPIESLKEIKKYLNPNGKIIIEVPNSNDALLKLYRSKSFANFVFWSCHLFVYNPKNLKQIVQKSGLKVKKIRYIQRYSLMNHMYWLLKHKAGGHKIWAKYDCKLFNTAYSFFLKLTKTTDTIEITAEI